MTDLNHTYSYFAGNFWMARAEYLRQLPRYRQWVANPAPPLRPFDRYLAELAVNRGNRMRPYVTDGVRFDTHTRDARMQAVIDQEAALHITAAQLTVSSDPAIPS